MQKLTTFQVLASIVDCQPRGSALSSRWKSVFCCASLLVAALSANLVFAQSSDASQPEIVLKSRTELVTVPVIVTDRFGTHVHSLKKEDFELKQDGALQKIANFEEVLKPSDIHLPSAVPGQFTNVLTSEPKPVNLTILMIDLLNTPIADQMNAKAALTQYLAELGKNPPPTSIFALTGGGLKVIHDFATDPAKLATALQSTSPQREGVEPAMKVNLNNNSDPMMQEAVQRLAEAEKHRELQERETAVLTTLRAMRQIAHSCAGLPGRKVLLWASGGFPFVFSEVGEELKNMRPTTASYSDLSSFYQETWKVLNQSQVAVYPVDVRGLTTDALADVENDSPSGLQHGEWTNSEIISTFKAFAEMTGGLAFYNTNGLKTAFEKATNDNREYYILSFYLNSQQAKTGWHKLNVRLTQPGMQVRARSGFYVSPNSDQHNDTEVKIALGSPVNYTAVPIVGKLERIVPVSDKEKGKRKIIFFLTMPANFAEIDESENNHIKWEFAGVAVTSAGIVAGSTVKTFDIHLNKEGLRQVKANGVDYRGGIVVPPGQYTFRFAVRDRLSGRIGSVSTSLKVD